MASAEIEPGRHKTRHVGQKLIGAGENELAVNEKLQTSRVDRERA
jgi:hypothetical protein